MAVNDLDYVISVQKVILEECASVLDARHMSRAHVLHVGCGFGQTTSQIVDAYPNVHEVLGIDSDRYAVDYDFTYVADEKMDFARGCLEDQATFDMNWAGKFDFVFASHVMLFVRDHSAALRNLMWCLKPGGTCVLAVPASKPQDFHSAVAKVLAVDKKDCQVPADILSDLHEVNCNRLWFHHPHADRVYSALLEQVGYQVLHTKLIDFKYEFPSQDDYKECLHCLVQRALNSIPEKRRESLFKQFCKTAFKKAKKTTKDKVSWQVQYALVVAKRPEE